MAKNANSTLQLYTEKFGISKGITFDGMLVCEGCKIARTGVQTYHASEIASEIKPNMDGTVRVHREPDEVFSPEAIRSFEGKTVVFLAHPDDELNNGLVVPANWKRFAVGHIQNVRRGGDGFDNYLVADLFVNDPDAIEAITSGAIRELSGGYMYEIEQVSPGEARQKCIRGNHVAIVIAGRAGPTCAIGDSAMAKKSILKGRLSELLARARLAKDSADLAEIENSPEAAEIVGADDEEAPAAGGGKGDVHIHLGGSAPSVTKTETPTAGADTMAGEGENNVEARLGALEKGFAEILAAVKALAPKKEEPAPVVTGGDDAGAEGVEDGLAGSSGDIGAILLSGMTGTDAKRVLAAKDSWGLETAWEQFASGVEIVKPKHVVPAFDSLAAKPAKVTFDTMVNEQKLVLRHVAKSEEGKARIHSLGFDSARIGTMKPGAVAMLFKGVVALTAKDVETKVTASGIGRDAAFNGSGDPFADILAKTADSNAKEEAEIAAAFGLK